MARFNNVVDSEKYKARLTPERIKRLDKIEALMIRNYTVEEIVEKMKIGRAIVMRDLEFIRQAVLYRQRKEYWKERIVNTLDHQLKEMWEQWDLSKEQAARVTTYQDGTVVETPAKADPRWQSGILAVIKEAATITGLRDEANRVEPVVVEEETKKALAPMSVEEYEKILAHGVPNFHSREAIDVKVTEG